ncbi:Fur family transcriptional regulator [Duganella sp. P38]|jgi:Fur family ferric uptake transcriptional regulator|uniref:Fur family transcriptional regulator n=1 Tax=Duganella sp. P38 TaxID=3423949 RepID=UPI003D7A2C49
MQRNTRQKSAILNAIEQARRPLTPQEILAEASREVSQLGMATVYRNLKSLLEDGALKLVTLPGENARYESTSVAEHHHHHFQCTACQRVFDVHACPSNMENLAPKGFSVERHELTLYGRCADCQPK